MDDTVAALPCWDLSDLYVAIDAPEIDADLAGAKTQAETFAARYAGRLATLDGPGLATAIQDYEALSEACARLSSYAQLCHARNGTDAEIGRFYQSIRENLADITSKTVFFTLELNRLEADALSEMMRDCAALARYRPWLEVVRAYRPYELSDDLERYIHDRSVTGAAAWVRLFDETMADLRFEYDGRRLTSSEIFDLLSDPSADIRKGAAQSIGVVLERHAKLLAFITNTLAKDKEIDDRWRRFPSPVSARNLANQVEDEVVSALRSAVRDAYGDISHRYYALKARWLGVDKLEHWDRNAPLPGDADRRIPWSEARDTVLAAYAAFSPDMAAIGQRFFARGWIDAAPAPGKDAGAFAHPTVPSAHPYLLLNYHGRLRDVMTLAHELGHGVHQVLAADQGYLLADTPLTLAETASVFGEMLTFQAMLAAETDPDRRRVMLAGKVEDMINTVIRQTAFFDFETRVHHQRRRGELTVDALGALWLEVQQESLGPAFRFDPHYRYYWSYIPHFVHAPFYVYAYAFGDCLVNALYDVYRQAPEGFAPRYLDLLRAGGSRRHRELLAPFGLDATDPSFWHRGLAVIGRMIDELETLG